MLINDGKYIGVFKRNNIRLDILRVSVFWAVICNAFFWDVLRCPATHIVGGNDLNNMFRIWLDYARSTLAEGQLPMWNPYLYAGYSFISDPQPALFYPPTWLSLLFSSTQGLSWSLVIHVWWMALGCTLWLRSISDNQGHQLSWSAAIVGGAVLAFSGHTYARIQAGHIGVISTASWLPWALWALNSLSRKLSWRVVGLGAISVCLGFLAGHTATFVYMSLMLILYTFMLTWHVTPELRLKYIAMTAAMGFLGVSLAGIQLLPMFANIISSTRLGEADYAFASRFSWPVGYLLTLLVPNFFGEPVRTGYWGDGIYDEMIFYVGILPLLLLILANRIRQGLSYRNRVTFWLGVAAVSLLTAFGSNGILHRLLYRFIPFISIMRAPARAGFLFTCSAAALAAIVVDTLTNSDEDNRLVIIQPLTPSRIAGVVGLCAVLVVCAFAVFAWGKDSNPEAGRFWHIANEITVFALFFTLAAGWLLRWKYTKNSNWLPKAALIIVLLDLWTLGNRLVQVVPAPLSGYWNIVSQHVDSDAGRVLPWGLSIFEQNGALPYNIKSVFGYNPVEDAEYNKYITYNPNPRAVIYDLLNVTHVSTTVPLSLGEDDSLSLLSEDRGVYIYNRTTALPRVWVPKQVKYTSEDAVLSLINNPGFDPLYTAYVEPGITCDYGNGSFVTIEESHRPEVINASVTGEGGVIVFSERYTAGWKATINGEETPLYKANGILQAMCVPPGDHQLQIIYKPSILIWGAVLSSVSGIICVVFIAIRRYKSDKPSQISQL